jgi:GNAT superfamily N-acetyltransferase
LLGWGFEGLKIENGGPVTGFFIRLALPSEKLELERLQARASFANEGDRDALLAHPDAIEVPVEQIAGGRVFVSECEGAIVGFAAIEPRADGQSELDGMFVEPRMQRRGIARSLIEHCAEVVRKRGSTAIHVVGESPCDWVLLSVWLRGDRDNGNPLRSRDLNAKVGMN